MEKKLNALIIFLFLLFSIIFLFYVRFPTSNVILNFEKNKFKVNETITGNLVLLLKEGELLPAKTIVEVMADGKSMMNLTLNEFIELSNISLEKVEGKFYVEGKEINGSGEGYGWKGKKVEKPVISFKLEKCKITTIPSMPKPTKPSEENISEVNITKNITEEINISEENISLINITNETEKEIEEEINVTEEENITKGVQEENVSEEIEKNITEEKPVEEQPTEEQTKEKTEEETEEAEETEETETEQQTEESKEQGEAESGTKAEEEIQQAEETSETESEQTEQAEEQAEITEQAETTETTTAGAGITGLAISNKQCSIIEGSCSAEEPFVYTLDDENVTIKLIEVEDNINESMLRVKKEGNKVIVETNYQVTEEGFGKEFLQEEKHEISLDIRKLNIKFDKVGTKELKFILRYQNETIASLTKEIEVVNVTNTAPELTKEIPDQIIKANSTKEIDLLDYFIDRDNDKLYFECAEVENITVKIEDGKATIIPDKGFVGNKSLKCYASDGIEKTESNSFKVIVIPNRKPELVKEIENKTLLPNEVITINLSEYFLDEDNDSLVFTYSINDTAIVEIQLQDGLALIIPKNVTGIAKAFFKASDGIEEEKSNEFYIRISSIAEETKQFEAKIFENVKWEKRIRAAFPTNISTEIPKDAFNITVKKVEDGKEIEVNSTNYEVRETMLEIEEKSKNFVITYFTPMPTSTEKNLSENKKEITVVSNASVSYKNVLAFTSLPFKINKNNESLIKLYWLENKSYVNFTALDNDNDNFIEMVEWIVPSLSKQTFILTIVNETGINASITNCSQGCLYVKSKETILAIFDSFGNLDLRGKLFVFSNETAKEKDLIFKNVNKTVVAFISNPSGNMYIKGNITQSVGAYCKAPTGSFIVVDRNRNCVAYIDSKGNLWLKGKLNENAAF